MKILKGFLCLGGLFIAYSVGRQSAFKESTEIIKDSAERFLNEVKSKKN